MSSGSFIALSLLRIYIAIETTPQQIITIVNVDTTATVVTCSGPNDSGVYTTSGSTRPKTCDLFDCDGVGPSGITSVGSGGGNDNVGVGDLDLVGATFSLADGD